MKNIKFLTLSLLLTFFTLSTFGQKKLILDKSSNAIAFSSNEKLWGLEVDGKKILGEQYKTINFQNGLFKLENTNGQWNVCDKSGSLKLNNWIKAKDVKITDKFVLFEEADDKMSITYERATWQIVEATKTTYDAMYEETKSKSVQKGTSFNTTTAQQRIAVKQAEAASTAAPFGAFSFRTNSEGKQELIVDDEILFTATSFDLFLEERFSLSGGISITNNVNFYKKTGRWIFRVEMADGRRKQYGLYILDINDKDGKKVVAGKLSIPIKYQGLWHHPNSGYAKCELGGFKEEYRNIEGVLMDLATRKPKEN